jgi:ribonuclease G
MLSKQIIINALPFETRIALIEGGALTEFYIERAQEKGIVGNIYKGRVVRVLPGMQSTFVDIGLERAAFLFGGDIISDSEPPDFLDDDEEKKNNDDSEEPRRQHRHQKITDLVREGQEILVQVAKDAIGTKGARVTTYLSLPGRYVVLMPNINHIGISRRIGSEEERTRLRTIVQSMKPDGVGIIVRTASADVPDEKIRADIEFLIKLWDSIKARAITAKPASLVHEDLNLVFRCTRDLMSKDIDRIVIDDKEKYQDLVRFLNRFSVKLGAQVQLYHGEVPIFDTYGVELDISRALQSKVWLKSGGYIVIDQTEALTAIDVNTGRFVGNKSLGDTVVKTNLEAVKEIVLQLRLRNMGGIIILDFIDMDRADDRERVYQSLSDELTKDKARTTVLRISEMGIVQMTRKRTEESLNHKLCMPCPYCEGKGRVKSHITVCYEIIRELIREFCRSSSQNFLLTVHPEVADRLHEEDAIYIEELKKRFGKTLLIKSDSSFHSEQFELTPA